jgi:hypothetical protein
VVIVIGRPLIYGLNVSAGRLVVTYPDWGEDRVEKYMKVGIKRNVRIILNLDPLVIGINLNMSIKQWNLMDTHLLISSSRHSSFASTQKNGERLGFMIRR